MACIFIAAPFSVISYKSLDHFDILHFGILESKIYLGRADVQDKSWTPRNARQFSQFCLYNRLVKQTDWLLMNESVHFALNSAPYVAIEDWSSAPCMRIYFVTSFLLTRLL
ncbi:hypothetical protein THIOM_000052 [Candidatus Thiomargarita nelsonii]|uniref:Uncharacterized protein n=1 Tax=Candidatus Thiomargarita nelsonii TaxID=1003181 RepID=A0A176S894_9GAMM|nr:hypothetical protein THIOM_000052 [Candidatus Thiomargarita nelsonii]